MGAGRHMLEARPNGWFSSRFAILRDGAPVAMLGFRFVGEAGTIRVGGQDLQVRRDGMASGAWHLRRADGAALASAEKPSAWRSRLVLRGPDHPAPVHLWRRTRWRRAFEVTLADRPVGSIQRAHMWSRRLVADLPADLPEPLQLLSIWMVLLLFRREDSSAATSSSG